MYILIVYVPEDHKERVKDAVFEAGGGDFGGYDRCGWEVRGTGQFRPLEGSDPYIGSSGEVERVPEYRLEISCAEDRAKEVTEAMLEAHPYEVPAYHLYRASGLEDL
jgi:hypothetical protein